MFIPRIYYPHPIEIAQLLTLDKDISHYLITVLRLKNNEPVVLFNGQGGEFSGQCQIGKKIAQIQVLAFHDVQGPSSLSLHLGQALARGDRMDIVIQKATELGIASITPLLTARCAVKMDEAKSLKRLLHWQRIAISACEQCGRTDIPVIHEPLLLAKWVECTFDGVSLVFDTQSKQALKDISATKAIRLAIGPESGWSSEETAKMVAQGFIACRLGPRILRTETAAIAAVSILQGLFGDMA